MTRQNAVTIFPFIRLTSPNVGKMKIQYLFTLMLLTCFFGCAAQENEQSEIYTYKKGDPNGIGKWYMGRQIAYVMGYQGISWLERATREKEERTSLLIENMNLKPNEVIADIGAGSGYHVFKIAPKVSPGKVYAVDIQREMLAAIQMKMNKQGISNIETVRGTEESVNLPEKSLDKVLLVDVYHEFSFPYETMHSIKKALKPNGKVYLIEYRAEDRSVPIKEIHKMTEKQAVKEMKAVGFKLKENISNLPWQHCMVFVLDK